MFCRWCNKKYGYKIPVEDFDYHEDKGGNPVIYLTPSELDRLKNVVVVSPTEKAVLDMFVFCCYTSLRFSDM